MWIAILLMLASASQTQAIQFASPVQEAAYRYGPKPMVMSGGFGSGKTWEACLKGLWLSDTFPRNRGVIARRVAKELRATTMATFFKVCPPSAYDARFGGRRSDQEGYLRLAGSRSEILFVHFEDPERQALLRGLEINWFFIDQAEEAPETMEEVFDVLLARLARWDVAEVPEWMLEQERQAGRAWRYRNPETEKPMPPPYAMLACNPDIELHWIYRRFHPDSSEHRERKLPELDTTTGQPTGTLVSYRDLGYRMFHMPSLDNKFLSLENKQALLAHDEAFIKRYVRGEWGLPEGAIHVIAPESMIEGSLELLDYLRASCTLHRFLDHGDSAATCCLWMAVDRNDNVFWYREYYLPNALISTHRQNITALSEGERYDLNQADPSIFNATMQKHGQRWAVSDEYADIRALPTHDALHWTPADNNELGTRNRINEYLRLDPERIHPITRVKGSPRMFFVKATESYPQGVVHAIRQIRSQRRVKIGVEMGRPIFSDERDDTVTDHAYDPVRYGMASRAPIARAPQPDASRGTFFGEQQRLVKHQRQQMRVRR